MKHFALSTLLLFSSASAFAGVGTLYPYDTGVDPYPLEPNASGVAGATFAGTHVYEDEFGRVRKESYWVVTVSCRGLRPNSIYYYQDYTWEYIPFTTDATGSATFSYLVVTGGGNNLNKLRVTIRRWDDEYDFFETILQGYCNGR